MDTGQCACKPGVIGRQCNHCDNPFAEVTSLGCEGNAIRHCSGEKGWLPPKLFNCTSGSFVDLKVMNEKLSCNETRMDGDRTLRLAKALRNATQHNGTIFGNDVRTAYHLSVYSPTVRLGKRRASPQKPQPGPRAERETSFSRQRRHLDEPKQFAVALVIIYWTLGQLLPEHSDPDHHSLRLPNWPIINTPVVSVVVYSEGTPLPSSLQRPVLVEFSLLEMEDIGGTGGWSAKGCELLSRNRTHITCQCSHSTSCVVLMDEQGMRWAFYGYSPSLHGDVLPLKIITYDILSLSLVALLVAFVLLSLVWTLCFNLHSIHKNLIWALFFS
ncbi:hypothetical protein U0070_000483 [Myodes glareolus]|uniref:Uncharacterized protein n=1 Tax=Myodes glareolus TaxID=447135 RepID=A0AAW0H3L5_MYOGA